MLRRALRLVGAQETGLKITWLDADIALGLAGCVEEWREAYAAGIRAVIDVCDETRDLGAMVRQEGIRYLRLGVSRGSSPGSEELHIATSWLLARSRNDGPVMLQDAEGANNDGMLACAALLRKGLTYRLTLEALARVRPKAEFSHEQTAALLRFAAEFRAAPYA